MVATCSACEQSATLPDPQVSRRPLEFEYVLHPGRTTPGLVALRCGVLVGPDSCWGVESAQVRLLGLRVIATGTAIHVGHHPDCGGPAKYDTLTLVTPHLPGVGRYELVAGSLVDDLWIDPANQKVVEWMVARGGSCPPLVTALRCFLFTPFHPLSDVAGGWLIGGSPDRGRCVPVYLRAEMGRAECVGADERNGLFVRSLSQSERRPTEILSGSQHMCRNIKTLANFAPPATEEEIRASALQFVRKLSGTTRPSRANEAVFNQAVDEVTAVAHRLVHSLTTSAPPRNREIEIQKARARARERFA